MEKITGQEYNLFDNIYSLRGVNKLYFKEQITNNIVNWIGGDDSNIRDTVYAVSLLFYIVNKDSDYINYFLKEMEAYHPSYYNTWEEYKEQDINEKQFASNITWDYFNNELKGRTVYVREEKIKKSVQEIAQYVNEYVISANIGNVVYIFDTDQNRWVHDEVSVFNILHKNVLDCDPNATTSATREVLARILVHGEHKEINFNAIAFNNCVYDFEKRMIVNSIDTVAFYKIDLEFKHVQSNEVVDRYFHDIMGGNEEYIELLWQFIGNVINPMRVNNYFWWFKGQSSKNGKSTLLRVISNAIGESNYSGVTFNSFTNPNNRLAIGDLYGKLLNIDNSVSDELFPTKTLNSIISGDLLYVDYKNQKGINKKIDTTIVGLSNYLPNSNILENLDEQCIIIPLYINPTKDQRIKFENYIKHLLLNEDARCYIINKGLEYAISDKAIVIPNGTETVLEETNSNIDEDVNFINELLENYIAFVKNSDGAIAASEWFTNFSNDNLDDLRNKKTIGTTSEVYEMYMNWCNYKGIEHNSKEVLVAKLRDDKRLGR